MRRATTLIRTQRTSHSRTNTKNLSGTNRGEHEARSTRRNVRTSKVLARSVHIRLQHLHVVDEPVDPEIDQGSHDIRERLLPRAADGKQNDTDADKDQAEESPALILHISGHESALRSGCRCRSRYP